MNKVTEDQVLTVKAVDDDDDDDVHSDVDEDQSITDWRREARAFRAKHEKQPPYLRIPFGNGYSWENPRTVIFFFHYRVFRPWKTRRADVMFINNFLAMITAIIAMFNPSNDWNNFIGGLSLFGGNLLLHSWYGYMMYSDAPIWDLNPVSNEGKLESVRQDLAAMIHGGDPTQHSQKIQSILTLPFTATNTLGRYLSAIALYMMVGCICGEGAGDSRLIQGFIYSVSLILGCLTWPIVFSLAESPVLKVVASFALFANEELYASYLFRKTPKEFCIGYLMALLGDFFPIDDLPLGLDDVLDDGLEEIEDVPGVTALQKIKEEQQNQTQAEEDLQERIDEAVEGTQDFFDKEETDNDKSPKTKSSRLLGFSFWRRRSSASRKDADGTETSDSQNGAFVSVLGQVPISDLTLAPMSHTSLPGTGSVHVTGLEKARTGPGASAGRLADLEEARTMQEVNAGPDPPSVQTRNDMPPELTFSAENPDPMLVVSIPIRDVEELGEADVKTSDKARKKKKSSKKKSTEEKRKNERA